MATVWQGSAALSPAPAFVAAPQSLFNQLQILMDSEQWNPNDRTQALTSLISYHAATSATLGDKYTAVKTLNKMHDDAVLMIAYMWGVYASNIFGVSGMPVDAPASGTLSEVVATVTATRTTKTLPTLPGPKH
jgi:hypothetical protein